MASSDQTKKSFKLRSQRWFDDPEDPGMTALYVERFLNFGMTRGELQSGKPIIGIAQTGSDIAPCNRHHLALAERVKAGIRDAGGIPLEFPIHPIQETGKRPTAGLDRNLAYLSLVEVLHGYPLDGVVLTAGCDKTTPAVLMGAATVNIPAIVLSGGPMLDGHWKGRLTGSGTIVWEGRKLLAEGKIDYNGFMELVASSSTSVGHCNTMGTALSMNSLAEALGMSLPGCAAIPGPYRERGQIAHATGLRIVDMVRDRRQHQLPAAHHRHRPPHGGGAADRGLGPARPRHPAAGRLPAGRALPRRGLPPGRRRAGGAARIARCREAAWRGDDRQRPHHGADPGRAG
jgi:dihydroxy-acid dehydratase